MAGGWRSRSPRRTRRKTGCGPRSGSRRPTARRRRAGSPKAPRTRARAGPRTAAGSPTSRRTDGQPDDAHPRLAPLDGGMPTRLGELPGPVSSSRGRPTRRALVVVCRVGAPDRDKGGAQERNAPRVLRGLAARLDGVGWQDGRRHLFVVDVDGRIGPPADPRRIRPRRSRRSPPTAPRSCSSPIGTRAETTASSEATRGSSRPAAGDRAGSRTARVSAAFPMFSPDGKTSRSRARSPIAGTQTPTCSSFPPPAAASPRRWRRTSIARPFCSRVCPRRCAGSATGSSSCWSPTAARSACIGLGSAIGAAAR